MSAWILPIAEREPLRWIVAQERTAFADHRAKDAARLRPGDVVLLYTTRNCFHNPTRDRGRVCGQATVTAPARALPEPVRFSGREYPIGVALRIEQLAHPREGVVLADVLHRLEASFPEAHAWSARMRRALVPLDERDATLLTKLLGKIARPYSESREEYARA